MGQVASGGWLDEAIVTEPAHAKRVAASEAAMLHAVRAVITGAPVAQLRAYVRSLRTMPETIGPTAMRLLTDSLRKGVVEALVRRGAWQPRRVVVDEQVTSGRLWQLRPELTLHFTSASFSLCRWLTGGKEDPAPPRTAADELVYYLAAHACQRIGAPLVPLASSSLAWLGFASWFDAPAPVWSWARLLGKDGQIILEALQPDLARHWGAMERRKTELGEPGQLIRAGERQRGVLADYLTVIDDAGRRDLATFVVDAMHELRDRPARAWTQGVENSTAPLMERVEACRASAGFVHLVGRIDAWRRELSTVAFYDEGYQAAQLLLARWETLGVEGFRRAAAVAAELEAARMLTG